MSEAIDYEKVGYVLSSHYRKDALLELSEGPALPTEVSDNIEESATHVSRSMNELREKGLTELLVSEDRKKGRLYGLTEEGHRVANFLEDR